MAVIILTAREAEAILKKNGWRLVRVKGSHHQYKKDGNAQLASICVHKGKTLSPGVIRHLYEVTGLDAFVA